ncbi:MAG: hypothetical protein HUU37_07040 [Bdellovibrionales bacterium]|nr:hypothetical protein [Bdellovibrionales bacterium]
MAALFTPESERLRADAKTAGAGRAAASQSRPAVPGVDKASESQKPGDSLGNPSSPGYEGTWLRKDSRQAGVAPEEAPPANDGTYVRVKEASKKFVRIQAGWERLLLAQKKICEKARNLFTNQEAPEKYSTSGSSKILAEIPTGKPVGLIVDLDAQEQLEARARKLKEEKEKAAA